MKLVVTVALLKSSNKRDYWFLIAWYICSFIDFKMLIEMENIYFVSF